MNTREWLASITKDAQNEIARRAGIPQRTLYSQIDRGLSAENVIRVAVAYSVHPFRALLDTGYIEPAWNLVVDVVGALRQATDEQLTDEILRRLTEAGGQPSVFDESVDVLLDDPATYGLAAHTSDEKGVPDTVADGEGPQIDPDEDDFDPA